jgi:hypothetical protein
MKLAGLSSSSSEQLRNSRFHPSVCSVLPHSDTTKDSFFNGRFMQECAATILCQHTMRSAASDASGIGVGQPRIRGQFHMVEMKQVGGV